MSRFQPEQLLLGCAVDAAVLLAEPASASAASELLASLAVGPTSLAATAALSVALPGLRIEKGAPTAAVCDLNVTLDDSLVRSFVVTPPGGVRGLRELRATAAARFAALYGEPAEQWLLVADWHALEPFVASALPRALYQALGQLAASNGWRLDSVSPALVRVYNRVCDSIPANGWLLVGFGQTLTLLATRDDRVVALRSLRLSDAPDLVELETLLTQELLRVPASADRNQRRSLLWAGAADWLPAATSLAGLESRTMVIRHPAHAGASAAGQLALAGRRR